MSVTRYDFPEHTSGATYLGFQMGLEIDDSPVNLSGATINLVFNNGEHILTNGDGITITDAGNGIFQVDSQIIDWETGRYTYELWITLAGGTLNKWLMGIWRITNG